MEIDAVEINGVGAVAEVAAAFADYEKALVAGDVERVIGWFWDSDLVVRYGVADRQTGAVEHRRWRLSQPPLPPGRTLRDTSITAFGADFAVVTTLFEYADSGIAGRQSQVWARLPEGWRIVSAHVSTPADQAPPLPADQAPPLPADQAPPLPADQGPISVS